MNTANSLTVRCRGNTICTSYCDIEQNFNGVFRDVYRGALYFLHISGFHGMRVVCNFVGICKKSGHFGRRFSRNSEKAYFLHISGFHGMRVVCNFVGICKKSGPSGRRFTRNSEKTQQHYVQISYTELHEHWTVNGEETCS
jgi:hypothetical protein